MMKNCILFLLFVSGTSLGAISPGVVKESALNHHPTVLSALENLRAGKESIKAAKGAFDTKIVGDYNRQTKHPWNMTLSRTQIEKGLRFANSKIYVGTEQQSNVDGIMAPIYNTGNPNNLYGNYTILGAKFSLWKNLLIDPDRAALKNANFDANIAKADKKLTELDIARLSQLAYWEWVTANKVRDVYDQLLKNGEVRNDYLTARSNKGDVPKISVTENEQYVASRKGSLQAASERLLRAEFALSLFYRDSNGEPILLKSSENYEDYPKDLSIFLKDIDLNVNIDELIKKRPDLRNLSRHVEKLEVNLELAKQDLKPQIDITTEYFERTEKNPQASMPRDYLMVIAQINIPIERNLGNGNIAAARARKMVAEREMSYGVQSYTFEVMALKQAIHLRLEQATQAEIEFAKAKELVVSENYKFKSGGGNLFLVNLREESLASAEASFHEARLGFMEAVLSYQALVNTGE